MALSAEERDRVRYHLGYLSVSPAASIQFGQPRPVQTLFLVESAMSNIIAIAEERIRSILTVLDNIECRLIDAQKRLAAKVLDGITLNNSEPDMLEKEYRRWAERLADILGVPLYAYSTRFNPGRNPAGNIPVSNG